MSKYGVLATSGTDISRTQSADRTLDSDFSSIKVDNVVNLEVALVANGGTTTSTTVVVPHSLPYMPSFFTAMETFDGSKVYCFNNLLPVGSPPENPYISKINVGATTIDITVNGPGDTTQTSRVRLFILRNLSE